MNHVRKPTDSQGVTVKLGDIVVYKAWLGLNKGIVIGFTQQNMLRIVEAKLLNEPVEIGNLFYFLREPYSCFIIGEYSLSKEVRALLITCESKYFREFSETLAK
jgi:hypothetical protein